MQEKVNSTPMVKGVWKQLFRMFYYPQKRLFHWVIVLAVITASTEAGFTLVTKLVVDEIVAEGQNAQLFNYAVAYFALLVTLSLCVRLFILFCGRLSTDLMYQLRKRTFEHLQELSFSFYDKHAVGWLVARVTSDCERIARFIAWGTLDIFWGVPFILGIFAVLIVLNWKLGLIIMAILPFLVAATVFFSRRILTSSRLVRRTNSRLTAIYNEGIAGAQTSKILVREQENLEEFKVDTHEMYRLSRINLLLSSAFFPIVALIVSVATGVALWMGGMYVMGGILTLGSLVAFITYTRSMMDPLLEVAQTLTNLQRVAASAERVLGLLAVKPDIQDSPAVLALMERHREEIALDNAASGDIAPDGGSVSIESIEFRDVSFSYNEKEPVLRNFNFKVTSGKTVALVGPTGSGKSTIVNLLCRFYEPTVGDVLINDVDYRERSLHWFQSNLGIVLQTPFLFSGTIRSNIRYGRLPASDEEIVAAAKQVNVHDIIMDMEHGYDTPVQEGGDNLSTGQKQLISFARAVIADPQILIMDEATSSVDTQTEHLLQRGLETILKNRTSFIIAHRLSTVRAADYILVIENGELQEVGNHRQLSERKGKYFDLYQKQFQEGMQSALLG